MISGKGSFFLHVVCVLLFFFFPGCSAVKTTYSVAKTTVKTTYKTAKLATNLTTGTVKSTYKIGKFTFDVLTAPLDWPMTHAYSEIDGLSPRDAIQQGRIKNAPYTVQGRRYYPMSVVEAMNYREIGLASWYGFETYRQEGGMMTANGEAFHPSNPTAAHKYLPLPFFARVTNLENGRSTIVRVNDRGPFVEGRIIDLTASVAKKLGFYEQGTANVLVEAVAM